MSVLLVLMAAAVVAAPEPLAFRSEVRIDSAIVRLSDVADLSDLPAGLRDRAGPTPVARLRSGDQVLSSRTLAARARGAVPALSVWLPPSPDQPVHVRSSESLRTVRPDAAVAVAPEPIIEAGDALTVRVQVGPVVVERDVRALQPGRSGRSLFVRTAEGAVLSARLTGEP